MLGPNIREYNDYRAFLKAFASYKKLSQPTWSYGVWARSLGLKATTSLTMIINGQRHPGTKVLKSLTDYFNFTPYEEAHFLNLVNLEKVKNQQYLKNVLKRELHGTQLRSHKPVITSEVFKQINQWHFLALRQ